MNQSELNHSLKFSKKVLQELEKRILELLSDNRLTEEDKKVSPAVSLERNSLLIQLSEERRAIIRKIRSLEKEKIEK